MSLGASEAGPFCRGGGAWIWALRGGGARLFWGHWSGAFSGRCVFDDGSRIVALLRGVGASGGRPGECGLAPRGNRPALEEFAVGHYVGESDIVSTALRAERSYAPANWKRLQLLREKYDPGGLFLGHFR